MQYTENKNRDRARKKKKKKKSHWGKITVAVFLLIIAGFTAYFLNIYSKLNHNDLDITDLGIPSGNRQNASSITDDKTDRSITNIALFGIDAREKGSARSDVIMIASVDKKHNKIKIASVMRDCYVEIEDHGKNKIGHAYFYGGPQLAVKTLNQNFGLDIKEYASVNFEEMATMIDAVGGVEITVTEGERLAANVSIKEQSVAVGMPEDYIQTAGTQTLNGTQAVAYARIRHAPTITGNYDDFGRTERQRQVLEKLFQKALDMSPLQYPEFARKFLPTVETSLDLGEILNLAGIMLRDVTMEETRFPRTEDLVGNGELILNGTSFLNADVDSVKKGLYEFIYDETLPEESVNSDEYGNYDFWE